MSITTLREAIATNLETIPDAQISAYIFTGATPPYLQVFPAGVSYDMAMHRGHDDVTFTVQAVVAKNTDVGSQKLLDRFMDNAAPYSVKAAVESDRTLGGACQDLQVTEASGVQMLTPPMGGEMLVVEWTVLVLSPGTS